MSEKNGNSNGNGRKPPEPPKKTSLQPAAADLFAKKTKFLAIMHKNGGLVNEALRQSGLSKTTAYDHLNSDPEFAEAWLSATETANDDLYREARRRALQGEIKYSVVKGKRKQYREKSDTLLIFLIKQHDNRIKWRQRITQTGNEALKAVRECAAASGLTEDQVQQVQDAILAKFKNISLV